MDELTSTFQEKLKISALSKSKQINIFAKTITIGPNASIVNNKENSKVIVSKENKKPKPVKSDPLWMNNKLFAETERLRQVNVRKVILDKAQFFKEEENRIHEKIKKAKEDSLKLLQERINQQDKILNHEVLNIELQAEKESALLKELHKVQEKKRSEDALRIQNKHLEQQRIKYADSLLQYQREFSKEYKEIFDEDKQSIKDVLPKYSDSLRELTDNMEKIIKDFSAKNGNIDASCIESAAHQVLKLKSLRKSICEEIVNLEKLRKEDLRKKEELKIAHEKQQNEILRLAEVKKLENAEKSEATIVAGSESVISKNVNTESYYNMYTNLQEFLKQYEDSYKTLLNDERYKKYRFDCQKAINMPINAITAVSGAHLTDKLTRLVKFLSGQTVEVGNVHVSIGQHPEAIAYCTDLLAKKFVRQGDLMVSSNPKSAFAFAAVIVALWSQFPDFGKLILAHFHRECIYLVPIYPVQSEGQTNEEYYRALGYRYTDGVVEEHDKFLKRMVGVVRLYTAIIVTKQRRAKIQTNTPHPHGLESGWRWLASILNLEPRIDITATLLYNFLDVAGNSMSIFYGKQFKKIITFIYEVYYPRMEKIDSGGPVVRFQVFLNDIIKSGRIHPPEGMLPDHFW